MGKTEPDFQPNTLRAATSSRCDAAAHLALASYATLFGTANTLLGEFSVLAK